MCKTILIRKGYIEYTVIGEIGEGEPILFVHGGHSNCKEELCHKEFNTKKYQLITPSRPGYGSTILQDGESPKQAAEFFIELLNALYIDKVIVYGISAGGLTAIELAANYPDRVNKLILALAVSKKWLDPKDKMYRKASKLFHPKIEGYTWAIVNLLFRLMPGLMAKSFLSEFSTYEKAVVSDQEIIELKAALKNYRSGKGFLNDIDQDIHHRTLAKIECPTLILHSKFDNSVSPDHAKHACNEIKNSRFFLLDNNWGHLIWLGNDFHYVVKITEEFIAS